MNTYCVILHIGNIAITKDCIRSLKKNEKNVHIVVVNNDTTVLSSKDFGYTAITVCNNKKNLGFAGGVNVGILYALKKKAEAILLLNNDTIIRKPFISSLEAVFTKNSHVGIVGPAICFEKNEKRIYDIGGKVDMSTGRTSHEEVERTKGRDAFSVMYITGAAMLIKKEVFAAVGLFDESFFLYYEDADFCLRAKEKGFLTMVEPSVSVYHLLSKTIGKVSPFAVYHQTRSAIVFGRKYMREFPASVLHMIFLIAQTSLITYKYPNAGIAGWKAFYATMSKL